MRNLPATRAPNLLMSENRVEEKMKLLFLLAFVLLFPQSKGNPLSRDDGYQRTFEDLKREIAGYSDIAKKIIDLAVYGKAQNRSYERLALFVDTIGSRLSGSKNLDLAIKYMYKALRVDGLENVHLEPAKIPHWERGKESAMMVEPRNHSIAILGLGGSIATPPEGITAEVLVVTSFDELHQRAQEAKGKIVVYNQPYVSYGETVQYRGQGAVEAAKVGAKASLIKTVAPFSINSPHTGMQSYQPGVRKIPTACISVEDAELMARISSRGNKIVLTLKMEAKTYPDADSFNTVAEIVGSKYPKQVVLVSGHLDSWDVGQGAMDDGGGAFVSWEALSLLKDLGLRPKRTLRLVLWTGEEQGGVGAEQYYKLHKVNISNFDIVMESDEGTFTPTGLAFTGSDKARGIMKEIMKLLQPINVTGVFEEGGGTDINYWIRDGIPGASLHDDITRYFWFHHSQGDTMTVQDPTQMNLCAAFWAVVSYVIADMEERVPV
ncbi:carboxypeptidase Q [Heteronotia binoei]|uniref:carboxypeptidase Q n=1 Tax=Heteronotia binoei TaxID=13085 RepID=UPI00292DE2E1|nr:carboxypeptidase Q [Heteronotia binoei]XP_060099446.1 carboxypeptidase Q [Heteronotia binoei]XP_060099447.1 carboxypeptidase Q [Heteronotia binoei]